MLDLSVLRFKYCIDNHTYVLILLREVKDPLSIKILPLQQVNIFVKEICYQFVIETAI